MDDKDVSQQYSRGATFEDLIKLCQLLKPEILIQTKDTYRPRDKEDRAYLEELIDRSKKLKGKKPWWRW